MPRLPICWTVSSDAGVFGEGGIPWNLSLCCLCSLGAVHCQSCLFVCCNNCFIRWVRILSRIHIGESSCPDELMLEWQADNTPEAFSFTVSAWQNQGSKGKFHLPRSPLIVLFSISQRSNNVHLWQPTMCPSVSCFQMRSSKRANADGS